MALDSEEKRWGMLQLATGPASYSHIINPSGSDYDSEIERLTLLHVYGGLTVSDTTAPVLSLPTGTATGQTTATGSVSTDEGNGTLYFWATTNIGETAADIKASGSSQAVSATGVQAVSFTGLTAETEYYAHYVHDDAANNESNVASSGAFTTDTADVAAPTGGFWFAYEKEQARKKTEKDRLDALAQKAAQIQDDLDKAIAEELRKEEVEAARLKELNILVRLAKEHKEDIERSFNDKVIYAANRAILQGNYSAMEALERQIASVREEEQFLIAATIMLINQ